jgi:hypothetical protein
MAEQASSLRDETALLEVRERARRLSERMASLAAAENFVERPQPEVVARELTCRAELSRVEGSSDPERWAAAAGSWRDLGYPFERAYARMREAEALAAGDGDREAMAEKTASVHVSHILAKLGVRSRVEAATAAHRLGLASPAARAETSGSRRDP